MNEIERERDGRGTTDEGGRTAGRALDRRRREDDREQVREVVVAVLRADDQRRRALVVHGPEVVLERRRHRPIDDGVRRGVALPIKGQ